MKKTITKLVLRKETLRLLAEGELAKIAGANLETCTIMTKIVSTCADALAPKLA